MSSEIDALDRALARAGQTITLRRTVDGSNTDVECPAAIRGFSPSELVDGITQQDSLVIISPTQINAAKWPDGVTPSVPSKNMGDTCIVNGKSRKVKAAYGIEVQDAIVRIEITIAG